MQLHTHIYIYISVYPVFFKPWLYALNSTELEENQIQIRNDNDVVVVRNLISYKEMGKTTTTKNKYYY